MGFSAPTGFSTPLGNPVSQALYDKIIGDLAQFDNNTQIALRKMRGDIHLNSRRVHRVEDCAAARDDVLRAAAPLEWDADSHTWQGASLDDVTTQVELLHKLHPTALRNLALAVKTSKIKSDGGWPVSPLSGFPVNEIEATSDRPYSVPYARP